MMLTQSTVGLLLVVLCCVHHAHTLCLFNWGSCNFNFHFGKRGAGAAALRRQVEKAVDPPMNFGDWSEQCEQKTSRDIDYTCFRVAIGQEDTGTTRAAFYSADTDRNGFITEIEFKESPFLSEKNFDDI